MKITSLQDLIGYLQKQSYHARVRILWGTVAVVAAVLFILWIVTLKSTIKHLGTDNNTNVSGAATQTAAAYATVERAENNQNNLKLYFYFDNPTKDILNVSQLSDIELLVNNQRLKPTKMTDRQGQPFVQKVLSHTQNFGILIFPKTDANRGELSFNAMFFEQTTQQLLTQTIKLNFKDLQKSTNLRH
jgi:hypothetical protein